jgi:hypothetical protein
METNIDKDDVYIRLQLICLNYVQQLGCRLD